MGTNRPAWRSWRLAACRRPVPAPSTSDRLAATRTDLAAARTALANERTLLAYVRTALALLAGSAALIGLADAPWVVRMGWASLPLAVVVLALGAWRFEVTRRRLRAAPGGR